MAIASSSWRSKVKSEQSNVGQLLFDESEPSRLFNGSNELRESRQTNALEQRGESWIWVKGSPLRVSFEVAQMHVVLVECFVQP